MKNEGKGGASTAKCIFLTKNEQSTPSPYSVNNQIYMELKKSMAETSAKRSQRSVTAIIANRSKNHEQPCKSPSNLIALEGTHGNSNFTRHRRSIGNP
jgi:hypothetical protein